MNLAGCVQTYPETEIFYVFTASVHTETTRKEIFLLMVSNVNKCVSNYLRLLFSGGEKNAYVCKLLFEIKTLSFQCLAVA